MNAHNYSTVEPEIPLFCQVCMEKQACLTYKLIIFFIESHSLLQFE